MLNQIFGNFIGWFLGGLAATIFLYAMLEIGAKKMFGAPMKPALALQKVFGWSSSLATMVHYGTSLILFPIGYIVFAALFFNLTYPTNAFLYGVILFIVAGTTLAPRGGLGYFFGSPLKAVMALVAHVGAAFIIAGFILLFAPNSDPDPVVVEDAAIEETTTEEPAADETTAEETTQ